MSDEEFPPLSINDAVKRDQERRHGDRRKVERRAPKRGSTIRIDDKDDERPKRVRRGEYDRKAEWPDLIDG